MNILKEEFKFKAHGGKVRSKAGKGDKACGKSLSWAKRVEEKKKELNAEGKWDLLNIKTAFNIEHCDFCGHRIVNRFVVHHEKSDTTLKLGCECVKYFSSLDAQMELIITEIRRRNVYVDNNQRCNKIYEYLTENQDKLSKKEITYKRYGSEAIYNAFDITLNYIKRKATRLTLERLLKDHIGINPTIDWYEFSEAEREIRNKAKNIKSLRKDGSIEWELDNIDLPRYPIVK